MITNVSFSLTYYNIQLQKYDYKLLSIDINRSNFKQRIYYM